MQEGWQVLVHNHLIEAAGAPGSIKAPLIATCLHRHGFSFPLLFQVLHP